MKKIFLFIIFNFIKLFGASRADIPLTEIPLFALDFRAFKNENLFITKCHLGISFTKRNTVICCQLNHFDKVLSLPIDFADRFLIDYLEFKTKFLDKMRKEFMPIADFLIRPYTVYKFYLNDNYKLSYQKIQLTKEDFQKYE